MTKDKALPDIADQARETLALFQPFTAAGPQMESMVQAQEGILREVEGFARNWLERRQEAIQSALNALHKMNSAGQVKPGAALEAITQWQRGSFERVSADLQEWTMLCMRCAEVASTAPTAMAAPAADHDGSGPANSKAAPAKGRDAAGRAPSKSVSKSRPEALATPV
ncbi:MAG: hypothetical protein JJU09_05945 [Rhodobacteraceae bacterium]|nr:hypothetical protein [Paracoccaceae bacterium]